MHEDLGEVALKDGLARVSVICAPDEEWRPRIEHLLGHKGEAWRWQVREVLTHDPQVLGGAQAFFYILQRGGEAFANIMTIEAQGVGVLGHVFTRPEERGQGGASQLMGALVRHFQARGGQALYLSTGFGSSAFRIYERHGFRPVEPGSGVMRFTTTPRAQFEDAYFAPGTASAVPLDWAVWSTASALFTGDFPGLVRNARYRLLGRSITEEALLFPLRDEQERRERGEAPRVLALRAANGAVVGLASWGPHPLWPATSLLDVYCHPNFWSHAGDLLVALSLPAQPTVAYAAVPDEHKARALEAAGFDRVATLPRWLDAGNNVTERHDVAVWRRG